MRVVGHSFELEAHWLDLFIRLPSGRALWVTLEDRVTGPWFSTGWDMGEWTARMGRLSISFTPLDWLERRERQERQDPPPPALGAPCPAAAVMVPAE